VAAGGEGARGLRGLGACKGRPLTGPAPAALQTRYYAPSLRGKSLTPRLHGEVAAAFERRFGAYAGWCGAGQGGAKRGLRGGGGVLGGPPGLRTRPSPGPVLRRKPLFCLSLCHFAPLRAQNLLFVSELASTRERLPPQLRHGAGPRGRAAGGGAAASSEEEEEEEASSSGVEDGSGAEAEVEGGARRKRARKAAAGAATAEPATPARGKRRAPAAHAASGQTPGAPKRAAPRRASASAVAAPDGVAAGKPRAAGKAGPAADAAARRQGSLGSPRPSLASYADLDAFDGLAS
jgi:hypothetical protein